MLRWALLFFLLAVFAAIFGFSNLASDFAGIAQILFIIFIVLFVISAIAQAIRGKPPV